MFESAELVERWYTEVTSTEGRCRRLEEEIESAQLHWPASEGLEGLEQFSEWVLQRCRVEGTRRLHDGLGGGSH